MDYLTGLQLILFSSILGLAVLIGSRFNCLVCQKEKLLFVAKPPIEINPNKNEGGLKEESRKLKDDFWKKLNRRS